MLAAQDQNTCLQRTVTVNVVGSDGVPLRNLTRDDLKVRYGNHAPSILDLTYREASRRVVILLDVSGSMSGEQFGGGHDKWQIARTAAGELATSLPQGSQVALIAFAEKAVTEVPLSADPKLIYEWLNRETSRNPDHLKGETALYDAILTGRKLLEPAQDGDAIYVITDGGENASRARLSGVEKALAAAGVRLFAFLLAAGEVISIDEQAGIRDLDELTRNTGGWIVSVDATHMSSNYSPLSWRYDYEKAKGQIAFYAQLFSREISGFYQLKLQIPEDPRKPWRLEVELTDTHGQRRKDVTLAYPRKIYPCDGTGTKR